MTPRRCLVVGSYPPAPGPTAAATVGAVRRAWAAGSEVLVASPRPSAAPHVLAAYGSALGRQVALLRRRQACDEVVVCVEPGWPFVRPSPAAGRALARAFQGAGRAELVVTGPPATWAAALAALAPLWPAVAVVTASSEALASLLSAAVPATAGGPLVRTIEPFAAAGLRQANWGADLAQLVGPMEPGELLLVTRGRRLAGRFARRVLGRQEPMVRSYLGRFLRPVLERARRLFS